MCWASLSHLTGEDAEDRRDSELPIAIQSIGDMSSDSNHLSDQSQACPLNHWPQNCAQSHFSSWVLVLALPGHAWS